MLYTRRIKQIINKEDQAERYYLRIYFFINSTMCILLYSFFISHLLASQTLNTFILFLLATLLLTMQYLVVINYKRKLIYQITILLISLHFLWLLYMGEYDRSTSLWLFCLPALSFMLLGRKKGLIMTGFSLVGIIAILFLPAFRISNASWPYSPVYKFRFIIVYLCIALTLFIYEGVIRKNREEMNSKHLELLKTQQTLLRSKNEVDNLLAEKEKLVKEVHHRIKNNMTAVGSILKLQAEESQYSEVKEELNSASGRLKSMMVLYNRLYTKSDNSFNEVVMNLYMTDLIHEILKIYPFTIDLTVDFDSFSLPANLASQLGIIVNELITNIMKYAFTKNRENILYVALLKKGSLIQLIIEDNGHNFHSESEHKGFGLTLVDSMAQMMDGQFTIDTSENTICKVDINVC